MNHLHASPQGPWPIQPIQPGTASRRRLLLATMALSLAACDKPDLRGRADAALVPGSRFPSVVLDHIAGGADAQGPFQGKKLVLNIWATWCAPCRQEMPSLNRLSKLLDPVRFAVLGLSVDANRLLAEEFLVQQGIGFRNFFDPEGHLSQPLGLKVYPQTFVIAADRKVLHSITGQREWDSPGMVSLLQASQS
jgi:thiol-disulfide isomerase/thioredoxin